MSDAVARLLARLARDRRAGVTMIGAGGLLMGLGCTAFAVDLGSIWLRTRALQGAADAAALAAAQNLADPAGAARAAARCPLGSASSGVRLMGRLLVDSLDRVGADRPRNRRYDNCMIAPTVPRCKGASAAGQPQPSQRHAKVELGWQAPSRDRAQES